ncbi:MAG: DUF2330 domain-containing protein [Planctomycetota bacterium]
MQKYKSVLFLLAIALFFSEQMGTDPCGMVPPIYLGDGIPIQRIGIQKTYAFYKDGMESFVIRPGFQGKVDEFGMLISFPSPPAIIKIQDDIFSHLASAIDPPEVVYRIYDEKLQRHLEKMRNSSACEGAVGSEETVKVLKEEAVGMYEAAVLEAGSSKALKRWMDEHGYKYPNGMDAVCEEYVQLKWCFVAVKARVGQKKGVDPKPGMRETESKLPPGSNFDGYLQAMEYRFYTKEFVLPMRLSAFNEGPLRNIVYILTDSPKRIANLRKEAVVRQISGEELYTNITELLPLRVLGGTIEEIPSQTLVSLEFSRNPVPRNGLARELFASDLLSARNKCLSHPHEEEEKILLQIGESLNLRGPKIDALHHEELKQEKEKMVKEVLEDLKSMTLTLIDDDFPREVVGRENLMCEGFVMPNELNTTEKYNARLKSGESESPLFLEEDEYPLSYYPQNANSSTEGIVYRSKKNKVDPESYTQYTLAQSKKNSLNLRNNLGLLLILVGAGVALFYFLRQRKKSKKS